MANHLLRQAFAPLKYFPGKSSRQEDLRALVRAMKVTSIVQELVRIGPLGDGGYLLPNDLENIEFCFSPGVADCSDFELVLANRGMKVFLADKSIETPPATHENFNFIKKHIASIDSCQEGLITLDEWYRSKLTSPSENSPEAILQMDIEGSEYEVIHNTSANLLSRFRIIVIEFHRLYQLADRFSFKWMASAIRKLLNTHAIVHMHPNNNRKPLLLHGIKIPATLEITFLRRDRLLPGTKPLVFPHPLDYPSVCNKPDVILPECWYT